MPPRSMNAPYSVRFLTMPSTIWPSLRRSSVDSLRAARSFSSSTRRDSTMLPRFLLNLMTLNLKFWPRNASRLRTGRRSTCEPGQERLHAAADRDREATLHARGDDAFDQLVAFARGADLVPHLEAIGLLLREDAHAGVVLAGLEEHVDDVARLDADRAVRHAELLERHLAFALVADIDDREVLTYCDHRAAEDFALLDVILAEALGEHRRKVFVALACLGVTIFKQISYSCRG